MVKKATLLKRAQKLGLDVTEKSKVPEIQAALDAHAKNTPKKANNKAADTPAPESSPTTPDNDTSAANGSETPTITLKSLLMLYNATKISRKRQIRNRNLLRNNWKELFVYLEIASGRSGQKVTVYDPNWQKTADKGGIQGVVDKESHEITVVPDGGDAIADTSEKDARIRELESQLATKEDELIHALGAIADIDEQLQAAQREIAKPTVPGVIGDDEALPGEINSEDKSETQTTEKETETTEAKTNS